MRLELLNTRDRRIRSDLAALLRRLGRARPLPDAVVSIVMVGDRRMTELNTRYRRRRRTTDVLAFPLGHRDPSSRRRLLGEVYVSRDRARAQGREYGTGYHGEVRRLALHGLLHLLGLGHGEMERLYAALL